MKKLGAVCETETEEGEKAMVVKLWGEIYILPGKEPVGYMCKVIAPGICRCRYSTLADNIVKQMQKGGIRLI